MMVSLVATIEEQVSREFESDNVVQQRLFLFGKLSGLNDKDAPLAAGYSLSVAENTKLRIWKPQVRGEFERMLRDVAERTVFDAQEAVNKPLTDSGRIKNGPIGKWGKAGAPMAQGVSVRENSRRTRFVTSSAR
jgi:phage terminase small subunit